MAPFAPHPSPFAPPFFTSREEDTHMVGHRITGMAILALVFSAALHVAPARAAEISKFLPNDTEVVLNVNVKQVLDSPLFKKHLLQQVKTFLKNNADAEKMLDALGFDPLKDVSAI